MRGNSVWVNWPFRTRRETKCNKQTLHAYFFPVRRNAPKLSFVEWNKYLDEISGQKNVEANAIKAKLVECGKPGLSAGTTVIKGSLQ